MLTGLEVPEVLHRNAVDVAAAGYEHTGETLINLATRSVGLEDLANTDILDVGCGVRFTMTIINRKIPIKSYTGIEVHRPIVDFLDENVAAKDGRFRFAHWNVHNQMYNPAGVELILTGQIADRWIVRSYMAVFGDYSPEPTRFSGPPPDTQELYPPERTALFFRVY